MPIFVNEEYRTKRFCGGRYFLKLVAICIKVRIDCLSNVIHRRNSIHLEHTVVSTADTISVVEGDIS